MADFTERHTQHDILSVAGIKTAGYCTAISHARLLADDPDDNEEVVRWLGLIREEFRTFKHWDDDRGSWAAPGYDHGYSSILDALGVEYTTQQWFGTTKRVDVSGVVGLVDRMRHQRSHDRRKACPTVTQWMRRWGSEEAIIGKRGHTGYVVDGVAFDLNPRDRVDVAFFIEE